MSASLYGLCDGREVSLAGAATSIIFLSRQTRVATNTCLSRQKYACRDKSMLVVTKVFIATKMILVAAPASDTHIPCG